MKNTLVISNIWIVAKQLGSMYDLQIKTSIPTVLRGEEPSIIFYRLKELSPFFSNHQYMQWNWEDWRVTEWRQAGEPFPDLSLYKIVE